MFRTDRTEIVPKRSANGELTMKKQVLTGIFALIVAAIIFVFADGAKKYYSGGFFVIIGIVNLCMAAKTKT